MLCVLTAVPATRSRDVMIHSAVGVAVAGGGRGSTSEAEGWESWAATSRGTRRPPDEGGAAAASAAVGECAADASEGRGRKEGEAVELIAAGVQEGGEGTAAQCRGAPATVINAIEWSPTAHDPKR